MKMDNSSLDQSLYTKCKLCKINLQSSFFIASARLCMKCIQNRIINSSLWQTLTYIHSETKMKRPLLNIVFWLVAPHKQKVWIAVGLAWTVCEMAMLKTMHIFFNTMQSQSVYTGRILIRMIDYWIIWNVGQV